MKKKSLLNKEQYNSKGSYINTKKYKYILHKK